MGKKRIYVGPGFGFGQDLGYNSVHGPQTGYTSKHVHKKNRIRDNYND